MAKKSLEIDSRLVHLAHAMQLFDVGLEKVHVGSKFTQLARLNLDVILQLVLTVPDVTQT